MICPGYRAKFRFATDAAGVRVLNSAHESSKIIHSAPNSGVHETRSSGRLSLQLLPHGLYSTAGQIEILAQFEDIYKPRCQNSGRALSTDLGDLPSWEWTLPAMQCCRADPLLNDVMLALVLGTIARSKKNPLYMRNSSEIHARALKSLERRLQNQQNRGSDYTLAAVMVFGMYEVCNP